jgi:hypothetical protein
MSTFLLTDPSRSYLCRPIRLDRWAGRSSLLVLLLLLPACCCGCAETPEPVTISSWQRSVERYVWDEGNGDPNVLRDLSWDDVHKGFAIMSDPEPARSTDAIGLLLGHRRVGQTGCFIFLVGLVDHQHLEDLRPVALYFEAGQFHRIVGPSDQQALSTYRRDNPGGTAGPPSHGPAFPRQVDAFSLDVQGEQISIMDRSSGASWKLAVPPP